MASRVETIDLTVDVWGVPCDVTVKLCILTCHHDGCGAYFVREGDAEDVTTDFAARAGWTWDGDKVDGCPLHPVTEVSDDD